MTYNYNGRVSGSGVEHSRMMAIARLLVFTMIIVVVVGYLMGSWAFPLPWGPIVPGIGEKTDPMWPMKIILGGLGILIASLLLGKELVNFFGMTAKAVVDPLRGTAMHMYPNAMYAVTGDYDTHRNTPTKDATYRMVKSTGGYY